MPAGLLPAHCEMCGRAGIALPLHRRRRVSFVFSMMLCMVMAGRGRRAGCEGNDEPGGSAAPRRDAKAHRISGCAVDNATLWLLVFRDPRALAQQPPADRQSRLAIPVSMRAMLTVKERQPVKSCAVRHRAVTNPLGPLVIRERAVFFSLDTRRVRWAGLAMASTQTEERCP